jgi:ATP phosphoribosyltransferase
MNRLRIGLTSKGRLSEQSTGLLERAGLHFRRQERSLFALAKELPVEITFLRAADIPVLCAEGAIDLGITGSDLVAEAQVEVLERLRLGIGRCRLAVCVAEAATYQSLSDLPGRRIATSFPRITERVLGEHNLKMHLVSLSGSVETMIALGVADAIVDLVETGSTLAANGLRTLFEIGRYEAVLIQGPRCRDQALADRVVRRLDGVVIASAYSLLEYNVPRSRLGDAEAITPGFKSPTISALEDPAWCAVRVMVRKEELQRVMEQLEQVGAVAILETEIQNCRL